MKRRFLDWFDDRTGYRAAVHASLFEPIPGGARWRYVWGSTLVFTFTVQVITGLFLWMAYSPSAQTAWESVYYIQHLMQFGWLLRGIHHFTAQAMVVLLALHLMQVIIDGAYKAPREVNFWLGLILMQIVLGLSLTGYLLPWDQKGYWATQVATTLSATIPVIGPSIQRLVVGGSTYGHHTLTRFFAMHAGVLPSLLVMFLVLHIYVFRRHGITARQADRRPAGTFWPDQLLKDAVACLGVLLVVLLLIFRHAPAHLDQLSHLAGENRLGDVLGAELGAPADPSDAYSSARPEWYFLFLFQFLKYFPGETEIYGAIVIPGAIILVMFLMPILGRWKLGHLFNIAYASCLLLGVGVLTGLALRSDYASGDYQLAVQDAEIKAERVIELIRSQQGIGSAGAVAMLRTDPKIQGPRIFKENCAQCHSFEGHDGTGKALASAATASDLGGFGTRDWIRGFVTHPAGPKQFGPTANGSFKGEPIGTRFTEGEMATFAEEEVSKLKDGDVEAIVEFLIAQGQRKDLQPNAELVTAGRGLFEFGSDDMVMTCTDCHNVTIDGELLESAGAAQAPDLSGYGSEEWLQSFVLNPGAEQHYGDRNAMRMFEGSISEKDLGMLVQWLRRDWYEPTDGIADSTTGESSD